MKKPEPVPKITLNTKENISVLLEIFKNTKLVKEVNEIEKDYPYWEKFKYKTKHLALNQEIYWAFLKDKRRSTYQTIELSPGELFVFNYNTTPKILRQLHEFDLHLGGVFEGRDTIPEDEKNKYLISSIMEEAIASSQLEGAVTTREIAKDMLRSERAPRNTSEQMIMNNYLTIKHISSLKNENLSVNLIKELHRSITKNTFKNNSAEGTFRDNNEVRVVDEITNEVFYHPPDFKLVGSLIKNVCDFANKSGGKEYFIHPVVKAIILHFFIGYIHPFKDGNGRTARALFYWYLIKSGYWLTEYMSISTSILNARSQYAKAYLYTEYDENDLTYFLDYNLDAMEKALLGLKNYIKRKVDEKKQMHQLLDFELYNNRQIDIIKEFINNPNKIMDINQPKNKFDVSYQTARADLLDLKNKGILNLRKMKNKFLFVKSEKFETNLKKSPK